MRVLIYVEPHPIRGSHTMFNDVARRFLPLLAGSTAEFDVRMYATSALTKAVGEAALAPVEKRLIRASPAEEVLFSARVRNWETEGIPAWLSLMAGGEEADDYVDVLRRIWTVFPYDIIVHWGENGAVSRFLEERPVTRIAMELGCTRAPFRSTVVMDPYGTNGSATVPRLSVEDLRVITGNAPMPAALAVLGHSATLEALPYEQQFQPLEGETWVTRALSTSQRVAFLPLQLHDDANLLRFSPYDTVEDVVLDVVPRLAAAGYLTVIKAHPDAKSRHQSRAAFALARASLRPWADDVIWLDSVNTIYSNAQLMSLADVVVTVNSSVGFESLFFDKVVVVLGDAVYKPSGLFPDLDEAIAGRFDLEAYLVGIGLLRRFMLDGYLMDDAIRGDVAGFKRTVLTIDAARRRFGDDPVALARAMYEAASPVRAHETRARVVRGGSAPGAGEFGLPLAIAAQPEAGEAAVTPVHGVYSGAARRLLRWTGARDAEGFRSALEAAFDAPQAAEELVRTSQLVDERFYLTFHRDVARAGMDPVVHWARFGVKEGRKPRRSLEVGSVEHLVDELARAAGSLLDDGLLPRFPLAPDAERRRQADLRAISEGLSASSAKVAVVAHLYYKDLVPEILGRLGNIPEEFDLLVTMPDWGNRTIVDLVYAAHPDALFYPTPDRGREIGPFLDVLPALLEQDYDAMLHVQTLAAYVHAGRLRRDLGAVWREDALDALLGTTDRIAEILETFRSDPSVRQIGPEPHYVALTQDSYPGGEELTEALLGDVPRQGFFDGTMFWTRPQVLRPLVGPEGLSLTNFPAETGTHGGALVHLVERLLGHAALAEDGKVYGAPVDPSRALVADLEPLAGTILAELETALAGRSAARRDSTRGALAW